MSRIDVRLAESVKFLAARRWKAGPEWHPRPHAHPFCEIIVVIQGAERSIVDGKTYVCDAGHVLFYPPNAFHEEWQEGSTLLEFYCIEFEWEDCPDIMPCLIHDHSGRALELARWLNSENLGCYPGCDTYREMGAQMLVAELIRLTLSPFREVVERVRRYVRDHLQDSLSLDDLAARCDVNKFHLVRVFRRLTGLTPMEYVRTVRLDTAYRLVLETKLPLRSIAPRVGIADEYHLSRLLKGRYGRGARELRRQADN